MKKTNKEIVLTYRKLQKIYDIIEEYDLEKEQRELTERSRELEGLKETDKLAKMLSLLGEIKKGSTIERRRKISEGHFKIYCIIFDLQFSEKLMLDQNVEEIEQIFFRFQNGVRKFKR